VDPTSSMTATSLRKSLFKFVKEHRGCGGEV
jgi:hypothetical protein